MRGHFGIGIEHTKTHHNVGTLWRSANILGASFVFTIGRRYRQQSSDTLKTWRHLPLYHYPTLDQLSLPFASMLIGIEMTEDALSLESFCHPEQCVYLLGAEDYGLSKEALGRCHRIVRIPGDRSLNVAAAGTVVLYDRIAKDQRQATVGRTGS